MKKEVNVVKLSEGEGHTVGFLTVELLIQRALTVPILPKEIEEKGDERHEHLRLFSFLRVIFWLWVLF